jgi:transcriptional regulator with XRE-family HTH domain
MRTLGALFATTRKARNLTLTELERLSRVPAGTLRDIEIGSPAFLTLACAVRIARALSLTPNEVFAAAADDLQRVTN